MFLSQWREISSGDVLCYSVVYWICTSNDDKRSELQGFYIVDGRWVEYGLGALIELYRRIREILEGNPQPVSLCPREFHVSWPGIESGYLRSNSSDCFLVLSLNYISHLEWPVAFTSFSSTLKSWTNLNVDARLNLGRAQLHTKKPQPRIMTVFLVQVSGTLSICSLDLHWNAPSVLVSLLPLFGRKGEGRNEHINVVRAQVRNWTVIQLLSRLFFLGVYIRFRDYSRILNIPRLFKYTSTQVHKIFGMYMCVDTTAVHKFRAPGRRGV